MKLYNNCGSFLIYGSNPDGYSLSIRDTEKVRHFKIQRLDSGDFFVTLQITFKTLSNLVTHYRQKMNSLCVTLKNPCLNESWEIDRKSIHLVKELSNGQFSEEWMGIWNGTTKVAVKILKPGTVAVGEFPVEAALMKKLRHPNLIPLYAVCTKEEPIYIITEFKKHGSLLDYLRGYPPPCWADLKKLPVFNLRDDDSSLKVPPPTFHWADLIELPVFDLRGDGSSLELPQPIDMGAQVAAGMAYLEKKNCIHRNLTARNILLGKNLICKVADFSSACVIDDSIYEDGDAYNPHIFSPLKWAAPEVVISDHFTIKSDVWSFGILLYEIITEGSTPYPGVNSDQVLDMVQKGYRMPCPNGCPQKLYEIMRQCWRDKAASRPSFELLQYRLEHLCTMKGSAHPERMTLAECKRIARLNRYKVSDCNNIGPTTTFATSYMLINLQVIYVIINEFKVTNLVCQNWL